MTITADGLGAVASRLGGPLAEYLAETIPRIAVLKHGAYSYIAVDDYEQAMWLEMLRRADHYKRMLDEGKRGLLYFRLRKAADAVTKEDDRYRRAKAASEAGYSTEDIEFYSTGLLARILPALVAADFDVSDAMQRASSGTDAAGIHIRTSDPFSGAENYLVMLADITTAWKRLPEGQRRLLTAYYGVRQDQSDDGRWERERLASSMGLTADALRQRVFRGLGRLQEELGGTDPWK
jgi:hypothetical protein